jgi:predicted ATPase/class 3 adenylate cyclase
MDRTATPSTFTFLFTDIEGSTRLWEEHPEVMKDVMREHDNSLRQKITEQDGLIFKHTGDGFASCFRTPTAAVQAAVQAQLAFSGDNWPLSLPIRVRMGIHTGVATPRDGEYFGTTVNKAARLTAIGHGGQILLSGVSAAMLEQQEGYQLVDLGRHKLRDLADPVDVCQVVPDGLDAEFAALQTPKTYQSNLPRNMPRFIGREELRQEVGEALAQHPLVTLAGIGGAGKTRLAQTVGTDFLPRMADGVWFIDLSPLKTGASVVLAVSRVLGIEERPAEDLATTVIAALRTRQLLLILDNSEQLTEAVADFSEKVAAVALNIRILATSRQPLGVYGEEIIRLSGLEPDAAIALFEARAKQANSRFELNRDIVGELVERLDYLPLAIELAAARVRSMSPNDILERIDERFRILRGSDRRVERHKTLEAVVDWSYRALEEGPRILLNRLALLVGSFDLKSAEQVCAGEQLDEFDIDEYLEQLIDKSLVNIAPTDTRIHYRLLDTVRAFARRQLEESGELEQQRERHLTYFAARATEISSRITGRDLVQGLHTAYFDLDNLESAIAHLSRTGRYSEQLAIVSSLHIYLLTTAPNTGRRHYENLIAAGDALAPPERLQLLLSTAGNMTEQGYVARARELLQSAEELCRSLDTFPPELYYTAATIAEADGKPEDVLAVYRDLEQRTGQTIEPVMNLGIRTRVLTSLAYENPVSALAHARESVVMAESLGIELMTAAARMLVGMALVFTADRAQATQELASALKVVGDTVPQITISAQLIEAYAYRDDDDARVITLARSALALADRIHQMVFVAGAAELVAYAWTRHRRFEDALTALSAIEATKARQGFGGFWWLSDIHVQARESAVAALGERAEVCVQRGKELAYADLCSLLNSD